MFAANATWLVFCAVSAVVFYGAASAFALALAHLVGERLFVGGLAVAEFSERDRLRIRPG